MNCIIIPWEQLATHGGIFRKQVMDAIDVPAQRGQAVDAVGGGAIFLGKYFGYFSSKKETTSDY